MLETLLKQLFETSYLEWIGFVSGTIQVILAWKNKALNFLFGVISVSAFIVLFYKGALYADACLNVYYFTISIVGWYNWKKVQRTTFISKSTRTETIVACVIALLSFIISYYVLKRYTDSAVPLADSSMSAFAWAGCWLMTRRKLENWIWLNMSNVIALPLYIYKQYYITVLYTLILFIVACLGFVDWKRKLQQ